MVKKTLESMIRDVKNKYKDDEGLMDLFKGMEVDLNSIAKAKGRELIFEDCKELWR